MTDQKCPACWYTSAPNVIEHSCTGRPGCVRAEKVSGDHLLPADMGNPITEQNQAVSSGGLAESAEGEWPTAEELAERMPRVRESIGRLIDRDFQPGVMLHRMLTGPDKPKRMPSAYRDPGPTVTTNHTGPTTVTEGGADIVERLFRHATEMRPTEAGLSRAFNLMTEAAAEITRLRAEVERLTGERDNLANALDDANHTIDVQNGINKTLGDEKRALTAEVERLTKPRWTCFHCGETFTDEHCARRHFGRDEDAQPACIIKGADGGLLRALRDAEDEAARMMSAIQSEATDAARAYHAALARHGQAITAAEEAGYEKGLRDGMSDRTARDADMVKRGVEAGARAVEKWAKTTFPAPEPEAVSLVASIRALDPAAIAKEAEQ